MIPSLAQRPSTEQRTTIPAGPGMLPVIPGRPEIFSISSFLPEPRAEQAQSTLEWPHSSRLFSNG